MAWDFSTDDAYQAKLAWADQFVRDECEPLDLAFPDQHFEGLTPRPDPAVERHGQFGAALLDDALAMLEARS